jgi:uncharacterized protein YggE
MDKSIQNIFFKFLIVFIIILSLGVISWGYYNYRQAQNVMNPNRVISFTGEGKILAKPDVATVSFSVVTQGKQAADVQSENNQKMQQVIDFVKKQGVDSQDITTTGYSLNPQYDYTWCRTGSSDSRYCSPKIIGYQLTQTVTIKIRDFTKISNIVGGLSSAGANQISDISFTIDDPENYKNEARIEALKKIEQRAQLFSKETSIQLGKIVNISESSYTPRTMSVQNMALSETAAAPSSAPIETGTQDVTVTLTVSYELK